MPNHERIYEDKIDETSKDDKELSERLSDFEFKMKQFSKDNIERHISFSKKLVLEKN
jgi:hypothetical protein